MWDEAEAQPRAEAQEEQRERALQAEPCREKRGERTENAEAQHGHGGQSAHPDAANPETVLDLGDHGGDRGEGRAQVDGSQNDRGDGEGRQRSTMRSGALGLRPSLLVVP